MGNQPLGSSLAQARRRTPPHPRPLGLDVAKRQADPVDLADTEVVTVVETVSLVQLVDSSGSAVGFSTLLATPSALLATPSALPASVTDSPTTESTTDSPATESTTDSPATESATDSPATESLNDSSTTESFITESPSVSETSPETAAAETQSPSAAMDAPGPSETSQETTLTSTPLTPTPAISLSLSLALDLNATANSSSGSAPTPTTTLSISDTVAADVTRSLSELSSVPATALAPSSSSSSPSSSSSSSSSSPSPSPSPFSSSAIRVALLSDPTSVTTTSSTTSYPAVTATDWAVFPGDGGGGGEGGGPDDVPVASGIPENAGPGSAPLPSPTPVTGTVVGGVIGGLAGAVLLFLVAMFLLRRRRHVGQPVFAAASRNRLADVPAGAASASAAVSSSPRAMSERMSRMFAIPAVFSRSSPGAASGETEPSERGFYKVSGRKLPSVLEAGGDGYTDPRQSMVSGTSSSQYPESHPPLGEGTSRLALALALGAPMRPVSGVPIIRSGPARTPVTENPFADPPPSPSPPPPRSRDDPPPVSRFTEKL